MAVNADKPERWPADIQASVALYNKWFMEFAPNAYRTARNQATSATLFAMDVTRDLRNFTGEQLCAEPRILPVLRMTTAPPLAVDRLVGLAGIPKTLVSAMERGRLPQRMDQARVRKESETVAGVLQGLIDRDLFPWLDKGAAPAEGERVRAVSVVADRLTASVANPDIRNAQEARQLTALKAWLEERDYREQRHPPGDPIESMAPGTFAFHMVLASGAAGEVMNPVDAVVQPHRPRRKGLPILIEAKSAGDFTNVNKRRKEEADKVRQLHQRYGDEVEYVLLLGGFFDTGYLSYEARVGIDWVWEHRLNDLAEFGI